MQEALVSKKMKVAIWWNLFGQISVLILAHVGISEFIAAVVTTLCVLPHQFE